MRRFAFAFIIVVAFVPFAYPLATGEVFTFRDHTDYFQPLRWFTAKTLRSGDLPRWNPYSASGEPWLANPQTCVFYPPAWIFLALPFPTAYMLFLFLHLALLGCGAYLFFSVRGSPGAALIGAVALMVCGPVLSLVDVQNNLMTFAWLPLILWCAATRANVSWSAAAIAMSFLAGEPFFATAGALMFAIVRRRDVVNAGVRAAALSAIQLVPFLAIVRGTDRLGRIPRSELLRDSMPLRDWLRVAAPPHLAPNGFDAQLTQHFIPIVYVGVLTVSLAAIGIAAARRRAIGWLVLLFLAIVIAGGAYVPFVAATLAHLPLTPFRYPARVVPLGTLAIVALAVEGWSALERLLPVRRLAPLIALALFAELVLHARPLLATAPFDTRVPWDVSIGRGTKILRVISAQTDIETTRREWISGYLNLYDRRFDVWTAAPLVSQRYTELYERAIAPRVDLLSMMSVGDVLAPHPLSGFVPVQRAGSVIAQTNPRAYPLAYARGRRTVAGPSLLAFGTSFIHAVIDVPEDARFIVTQQNAPGWSAVVDGRSAESSRAELFLTVNLSRGHHDVVWKYRPASLPLGMIATFLAIVAILSEKKFVKRSK